MSLKFGNRVTEKDIRDWLDKNKFDGRSAEIAELELHAIKRPGWVQLYRFRLKAKSNSADIGQTADWENKSMDSVGNQWQDRVGVVLDDERIRNPELRTQIWIFESPLDQSTKLDSLSSEMLTCRTGQNGNVLGVMAVLIMLILIAVFFSNILVP
jgi:hypothetical protein